MPGNSQQRRDGRLVVDGSTPRKHVGPVTSGAVTGVSSTATMCGFVTLAESVVTWTTISGDTVTAATIPAGVTIVGHMTACSVTSGSIIAYFP